MGKPKFRRGTTPPITVTVDADLSDLTLHLSFMQGETLIVKEGGDLTVSVEDGKTTVTTTLTQEDTLAFDDGGDCEVQIRGYKDGGIVAVATGVGVVEVKKILEEGVLPRMPDWDDSE